MEKNGGDNMRRSQRPPKPTFWETLKSDFFEYFKLRYRILTDPDFRRSLTWFDWWFFVLG